MKFSNKFTAFFQAKKILALVRNYPFNTVVIVLTMLAILVPLVTDYVKTNNKTETTFYVPHLPSDTDTESLSTIECWNGSLSVPRADAYRCMTDDHIIYDPCFSVPLESGFVSCPEDPKSGDVFFKTDTTYAENKNDDFGKEPSHPWFIKLRDNSECRMITGVTYGIANNRMDYSCEPSGASLFLPAENRDGISYIKCLYKENMEECAIKEIWY